jgi:hypothetical protein
MHRRRGLVSQVSQPKAGVHVPGQKRDRSGSDSGLSDASSVSSALSSGLSDLEEEFNQREQQKQESKQVEESLEIEDHPESPRSKVRDAKRNANPRKKEKKEALTDETKWQKMKLKGSDKELLVDMSRVQKYVDYDSVGVQSFQSEVQQTKGNFRQQLADYSDL